MAFEKIIDNLEKLVQRYDKKLSNLSKPLTKEEILVDLQDFENGGQDPESKIKFFINYLYHQSPIQLNFNRNLIQ